MLSSPFLFTHTYDIDTLITALGSGQAYWLNTSNGTLHTQPPPNTPAERLFHLQALPASYLATLHTADAATRHHQLREAALTWLTQHNLLPPSLRGLSRISGPTHTGGIHITPPVVE